MFEMLHANEWKTFMTFVWPLDSSFFSSFFEWMFSIITLLASLRVSPSTNSYEDFKILQEKQIKHIYFKLTSFQMLFSSWMYVWLMSCSPRKPSRLEPTKKVSDKCSQLENFSLFLARHTNGTEKRKKIKRKMFLNLISLPPTSGKFLYEEMFLFRKKTRVCQNNYAEDCSVRRHPPRVVVVQAAFSWTINKTQGK